MSQFEYLSVMLSIVIALGISEMASSWGRLLRNRANVRFDWLHGYWCAFTGLLMVQFWWGFWSFRTLEPWSFADLLAVVFEGLLLVISAIVLIPGDVAGDDVDLREHFLSQSRLYFCLAGVLLVAFTATDCIVLGQPLLQPENLFRLPGVIVAGLGASSRDERLHRGLAAVAAVLLVGFLAFAYIR